MAEESIQDDWRISGLSALEIGHDSQELGLGTGIFIR